VIVRPALNNQVDGGRRGRAPVGLIGMIAAVVAVESLLSAHAPGLVESTTLFEWRVMGRTAAGDDVRRSEVLFFGDSLLKRGIYPPILEAKLGRPTYNLALTGGTAPSTYFLLRRALDHGARPRAVVVDFHAAQMILHPDMSADYWPELLSMRELFELSLAARAPRLWLRMSLAKALPSVNGRCAIRSRVLAALQGQSWPLAEHAQAFVRNWRVNRGALIHPLSMASAAPRPGAPAQGRVSGWWLIEPTAPAYIGAFLDLAARRGIAVFWVLPPYSPAYQAIEDQGGRDALFTAFVRATQARYPNVVVIDGRRAGYRNDVFADATHLNRHGASAFSQSVAALLGPHLAGAGRRPADRWVNLPAYQDRPEPVPLEDITQSMTAMQGTAGSLRR
jgi:hypothetical protein